MILDTNAAVALAAFAIGAGFGALARWSGFCMRGAVEDALTKAGAPRLRGFLLAMAVAVIATQALVLTGRLDLSKAIVLPSSLFWVGALLGGALFGVGMTLTGGCGTRLLVLAAGGNLRSVVSFVVFALVAYATVRGVLAPARTALMAMGSVALPKQALPIAAGGIVVVLALAFVVWRRVPVRHLVAGPQIRRLVALCQITKSGRGHDRLEITTTQIINNPQGRRRAPAL